MKNIYPILCLIILLPFASCNSVEKSQQEPKENNQQRPNIIFILADDLGWADLPNYGNTFNEAPNIKKLASEGIKFNNAYSSNPVCSPSRASIQTGLYPARIGINDFLPGHWRPYEELTVPSNKTQYLPLEYETIGEILQKTGYRTGYFGKWHLGFTEKHYPKNQGYNESAVYNGGGFFDYNDNMVPKTNYPEGTVLSEALTNLSLDFMDQNKEQPFFLFLSHYDVHVQLEAQDELIEKYLDKPKAENYPSNAIYAAMVENVDISVGRIMDKLKELDLDDNTVVVFFSDNGGLIRRFDEIPLIAKSNLHYYENDTLQYIATSNKPLRAEKGTVYEGGIKVPLIVKWPGKVQSGTTSNALVSGIDLFPTFVEMANAKRGNQPVDGKSVVPEISGSGQDPERTIFWHYPVYHHAVPAGAIRKGEWKLIHFFDDNHLELYNLKNDIGETINLIEKEPERGEELFNLLKEWRHSVNADLPVANPNFNSEKRTEWGRHPNFNDMLNGGETIKDINPTN